MRAHWFSLLAAGALLVAWAVPAAGQSTASITINPTKLDRDQPSRPLGQKPRWISQADCLNDDVLTFYTTVSPVNDERLALEVWAGSGSADCTKAEARGVASNTCWLVYRAVPRGRAWLIDIRAQDIVAQNYPSRIGSPGSADSDGVTPGTAETCESGGASGPLVLTFMFTQNSQVVGTPARWEQTGVDVTPPPSPYELAVEPDESRLRMEWSTSTPSDLLEWRFYCDPTRGGTSGEGYSCLDVPSVLVPGEVPSEDNRCGTATGDITRSGHAEGLENDVTYAVGVLGVDDVGNVGKLSEVRCGTPAVQPDSGEGGCGFCSVSRRQGRTLPAGLGAVSLVGLGLLRRFAKSRFCPYRRGESPC